MNELDPIRRAALATLRKVWRAALLVAVAHLAALATARADEPMQGAMAPQRLDSRIQDRMPRESGARDLKRTDEKLVPIKIVKTQPVSETGRERPTQQVERDLKTRRVAASQN